METKISISDAIRREIGEAECTIKGESVKESPRLPEQIERKTSILFWVVAFTLILSLANTYTMFGLATKSGAVTGVALDNARAKIPPLQNEQVQRTQINLAGAPVRGSPNAPVKIVEFSDFQCPFCSVFYLQTLPQLAQNYINMGKVQFVYKAFPLSFHPFGQKAAEASKAAEEQGKFWEYHDILFQKQDEWSATGIDKLKEYAKDLGLDTAQFNAELDSGKYATDVQKEFREGQTAGVGGTPTFFVNGIKLVGAQPYSAFQQIIEQELNKI